MLQLTPNDASLVWGPGAELALEARQERRIVWAMETGAPVAWFGDDEEPVFAGPRSLVTRREARLFSGRGELEAILAGRDAIEVRVHPECDVIALRLGGPEYSLRTFSSVKGEVLADFPWIPARFEPDFDYQPACDGRKVLVYSRPSPPLPRSDPTLADQVLFLGAESVVLGRWAAPRDEEILSARFSDRRSVEAQIVSRKGGDVLRSRVTPLGKRAVLERRPDTAESRRELLGAPSILSKEERLELGGRLAAARSLPLARVEQMDEHTLLVHSTDGRSATLSVAETVAPPGAEAGARRDPVRHVWLAAEVDLPGDLDGAEGAPVFAGPDGAWVLHHPASNHQLAIWLVELPGQKWGSEEGRVEVLVTSPTGAFYSDSKAKPLVYYPSGHGLVDESLASVERCAQQFRSEILHGFLQPSPSPSPASGGSSGLNGREPEAGRADPCSSGPQVGRMLGSD